MFALVIQVSDSLFQKDVITKGNVFYANLPENNCSVNNKIIAIYW